MDNKTIFEFSERHQFSLLPSPDHCIIYALTHWINELMAQPASHLGLLRIAGDGAKKLLQGQLTCNLDEISSTQSCLGAHCNPQGRIISLFRIFLFENAYYLQMPLEMIPIASQALKKYAVFFKVDISDATESLAQIAPSTLTPDQQKQLDIKNSIPAIYPETSEKFLPHEINLIHLNAVSFNKGCYTGQEIIARMEYRGKLKTHLCHTQAQLQSRPIRGNDIHLEDQRVGTIVDYYQTGLHDYELLIIAPKT